MNYLICAGGSGLRVLEAMIHLCAMGIGPKDLHVLAIDPDIANVSRARALFDIYQHTQSRVDGGTCPDLKMFHTKLQSFGAGGTTEGLTVWSPVDSARTLKELLHYDCAPKATQDVARLFFTKDELDMELSQGFRGHAAVGAAAMSMALLSEDEWPWREFANELRHDLMSGTGARVFIAASVFGGTGASAIHPLAQFIRKLAVHDHHRLRVGVAALAPYFRFRGRGDGRSVFWSERREKECNLASKAEQFPFAAYSVAQYYQHLRSHDDWPVDAMYWMGDSNLMDVRFALGGTERANPPHFVELLAALSALGFYARGQEKSGSSGSCYYAGPRQRMEPTPERTNVLDWDDLPLADLPKDAVRRDLLSAFVAGAAHVGFYWPLLNDPELYRRPHCVPWYFRRFVLRHDSLTTQESNDGLRTLTKYFSAHMFPWWIPILMQNDVRLFSRNVIPIDSGDGLHIDLHQLAKLLSPNDPSRITPDVMDRFFTDMVAVPLDRISGRGAGAYLTLLSQAAERFVDREFVRSMTTGVSGA